MLVDSSAVHLFVSNEMKCSNVTCAVTFSNNNRNLNFTFHLAVFIFNSLTNLYLIFSMNEDFSNVLFFHLRNRVQRFSWKNIKKYMFFKKNK